jgi:hypothetical protein
MKSRAVLLGGVFALFLLVYLNSHGKGSVSAERDEAAIAFPSPPAEIKPVLRAMKQGDREAAWNAFCVPVGNTTAGEMFEKWLGRAMVKGRTSEASVVAILGKADTSFDRPARDGFVTTQYRLCDERTYSYALIFHFDAQTRRLLDWGVTIGICGFCPHVFAYDGTWRLEGKMLAGCVGRSNEGSDTLLLPRLKTCEGGLRVKLANLAPEVEYLDQVQLGAAALENGEELDLCFDGRPYAWKPARAINSPMYSVGAGEEAFTLRLEPSSSDRVLVIEAFNTSQFEKVMREFVLRKTDRCPDAILRVQLDGEARQVQPVGTKFLRRIVVPIEPRASMVRLKAKEGLWFIRRLWIGSGRSVEGSIRWQSPDHAGGPVGDAKQLLLCADGQRLRLDPNQEVELTFNPMPQDKDSRTSFVLRMTGYYDLLAEVPNR